MARTLKSDKLLFWATLLLVGVSVVMVYSASAIQALDKHQFSGHVLLRQTTWAVLLVGLGLGLIVLFVKDIQLDTDLIKGLPYLGTLVVLAVFSRRLRPPMAAGQPYRKGQIG